MPIGIRTTIDDGANLDVSVNDARTAIRLAFSGKSEIGQVRFWVEMNPTEAADLIDMIGRAVKTIQGDPQ